MMDECWCDVTGCGIYGTAEDIAEKIRQTIKFELGLTVSIGVSYNKIFAKLGSDMRKPDAITVIKQESFKEQIWQLPASELLGVGRSTDRVLNNYGIHTIGQLAAANEQFLKTKFGVNGLKLKEYANGNDISAVMHKDFVSPIKSIGHGTTTVQDLENSAEVWRVILMLSQDIGTRVRKHEKRAGGVAISVRNNQLESKVWQAPLEIPTQSSATIAKASFDLFCRSYVWQHEIRSITVRAINLIDESVPLQCDMFLDFAQAERSESLDIAIEKIRQRFGKHIIKNAVLCQNIKLSENMDTGVVMPTGLIG